MKSIDSLITRELKTPIALGILLLLIIFFTSSCTDDCEITHTYVSYEPVYLTTEEIRESVEYLPAREINSPGRIYYKDGFLYINEVGKGIHVIDNRNPQQPQKLGFVNLPGNFDLAAKGNYLYADSYVDLVILDISDPSNVVEVNREYSVFAEYDYYAGIWDENKGLIVEWEETVTNETFESDCESGNDIIYYDYFGFTEGNFNRSIALTSGSPSVADANSSGVGGSLAKFTIYDNYLYTINSWEMRLFDISNLTEPETGPTIQIGWGIETLFPYGDKLFIGANNGMHIYDNQDPESPVWISTYQHINSCDPVVVQGDYAYVTLRSGNECAGFTNQLDVVDISDLSNPHLYKTYPMQNPHGLGIDGTCLFITEGEFGLKFFDASDIDNIELVSHQQALSAIDVIPLNDNLMVIGNDGFHQYQYDCETGDFNLLSSISIIAL